MKKTIIVLIIIFSLLLFFIQFSCMKGSDSTSDEEIDFSTENIEELNDLLNKLGNAEIKISKKNVKNASYSISSSYLKEPLGFTNIGESSWKSRNIGIIGSDGVKLYADLDGKNILIDIPKGTIIEIKEEHKNPVSIIEDEELDFYQFDNEYNYWYSTEYHGNQGYVFGSYIVHEEDSYKNAAKYGWYMQRNKLDTLPERLVRLAFYYKKPVRSDKFYDFNGGVTIPNNIKDVLIQDKFALKKIAYQDYQHELHVDSPDDMIALYKLLHSDRMATTYITIDFLIHNLHLLFDRMMEDTETNVLYPLLQFFVTKSYNQLLEYENALKKEDKVYAESINILKKYFLVPADILELDLVAKEDYPNDVKEELRYIEIASGFVEEAPIFKYKEDYSQFKPRGHYTKSDILKKYFKAMMWFGRLHFYCVTDTPNPQINKNAIKLTSAAIVMTKLAKENQEIYKLWRGLFIPITYIVGDSDDYHLEQYMSISDNVNFANIGKWLEHENNIVNFIKKANRELKAPNISGNTLMQSKVLSENTPKTPAGFRLFGQRFTFDSFIHNMLSAPRVQGNPLRSMVKGLDIMGVFGNKLADESLAEDKKSYPDYKENYQYLKNTVENFNDSDWKKTFYNSYLRIIKESTTFDESAWFYFTQSKNWKKRALLTSFGAWAELRHDTILYVKQSYGEKAGKGIDFTWVVDKVKRPIGYVEPNLSAILWIQSTLDDAIVQLSDNGFMSDAYKNKYKDYKDIIDKLVQIVEIEAKDGKITEKQNEYIYSVPYKLANIILPATFSDYFEKKDLQMALVADVHTDSDKGKVLEVATGIPYKIYVALNDGNGGKRIAEGYTYSYYEFHQPMSNRLNDDQWKAKVYGDDEVYIESKIPEWLKDIVQQ